MDMEKQCKARKKPQKLLKQSLHNTKNFLHKTYQNIKSLNFGGCQKLPKIPFPSPFLSSTKSNKNQKIHELDEFFKGFSEHWKSNLEELHNRKTEALASQQVEKTEEKVEHKKQELKKEEPLGNNDKNGGGILAEKMKEFEMLEVDDVDHVLDIEEVMHYYNRLSSPIYQEMVDKFFVDMYSEFSHPQPSVSCNSSMRRLGPLKL